MPYEPVDHLMWDFWFAPQRPGEPLHCFYLRVPGEIGDPEDRHWQAEVGHATTVDLRNWEDKGIAFGPSEGPAWDDKAIWTGSILRHDDRWYWFYTALTHADREQRIGLATSNDLMSWERHAANPLLTADPTWYESAETSVDGHVAFRDPWVVPNATGDGWLMYITARINHGPMDGRGVIALARSPNLINWTLEGPVTEPGQFGEMEVPQLVTMGDDHYLLFCTGKHSQDRLARPTATPWIGTHYLTADRPEGPWRLAPDPPLAGGIEGVWYAGRAVEVDGDWYFFAWRRERDGRFAGGLSNPARLQKLSSGRLAVDFRELN